MMALGEKRHQSNVDRRQRECSPPPGTPDRRIRAELRDLSVSRVPFKAWAEAASNFYYHPSLPARIHPRRRSDRRLAECGPPLGCAERRITAERRRPGVASITIGEWAEAMSNYYYLFHGI